MPHCFAMLRAYACVTTLQPCYTVDTNSSLGTLTVPHAELGHGPNTHFQIDACVECVRQRTPYSRVQVWCRCQRRRATPRVSICNTSASQPSPGLGCRSLLGAHTRHIHIHTET